MQQTGVAAHPTHLRLLIVVDGGGLCLCSQCRQILL
jgi:hypothetical protein